MSLATRTRRALSTLHVAAVAVLGVGLAFTSYPLHWSWIAILTAVALLVEAAPVRAVRHNVHITLGLPMIAGLALVGGPFIAIIGDVLCSLVASLALAWRDRQRPNLKLLLANLSISSLCAGIASIALVFWPTAMASDWTSVSKGMLFALIYAVTNFLVVTRLDAILHGRPYGENALASLKIGGLLFVAYAASSAGVAVLISEDMRLALPAVLLPLVAARMALVMKTRLYDQYDDTLVGLMLMLHRAHPYTHGHLQRVSVLTEKVGIRLGLNSRRARLLREAAVLHDIGKIAVDERILQKPGKLTPEEYDHVRQHAQFGATILAHARQFAPMVAWIQSHHERPDGAGYPNHLVASQIPLESKIIAVTDAFDAMVGGPDSGERRPYREPMSISEALEELRRCSGAQFDGRVVEAFAEVLEREGGY